MGTFYRLVVDAVADKIVGATLVRLRFTWVRHGLIATRSSASIPVGEGLPSLARLCSAGDSGARDAVLAAR